MKKFWLPVFFLICVISIHPQQDKPIISVLDFTTSEVSEAEMHAVINLLSSSLFKTNCFTVIDVGQRETVLKEMEFSMSGCSDESCMLEIGKLLSAEAIVVGNISRVGATFVFSAKMLETETAKTLSTTDGMYPDMESLLTGIRTAAEELSSPFSGVSTAGGTVEPEGRKAPEPVRPVREPREPIEINIPAVATLAGGVASAGVGIYFLSVAWPLVSEYLSAKKAYNAASDLSTDITALWNEYEAARVAALEGGANTNVTLGAAFTGLGVALGVTSAVLFFKDRDKKEDEPFVSTAFLPVPGAATLSCRIRY